MVSPLAYLLFGLVLFVVLPVLGLTWYSIRADQHSPAQLQEERADA